LDKDRFNVIFIYLSGYDCEKYLRKEAEYEVFYLSNKQFIKTFRFSILFKLVRILREKNIDILHCHRYKSSLYGALAGMFAKQPVILSHVHGLSRTRNIVRKLLNFFVFSRVDRIIGCTSGVLDDVLRDNLFVRSRKLIALENSVDFNRFADESITKENARKRLDLPADAMVFGTVGRLVPTKGQSYLIQAFAQVKKQLPQSILLIVGTGRLESVLKAEAEKTGFCESIRFLGQRKDVVQILKSLDIFILPSVAEGFGLALAEAMAAGIPCIATEVGGIPEVTNGTEAGVLVPPRDSAALAVAVIKTASMPVNELAQLVDKAQNRVRCFYSYEVVGRKLANLYESEFRASTRA